MSDPTLYVTVGDTVRVGTGHTTWVITDIWTNNTQHFAQVARPDRPDVRMSYPIERLKKDQP